MVAGQVSDEGIKQSGATNSSAFESATRNGVGEFTVTFVSGTFTVEPIITVTVLQGGNNTRVAMIHQVTTSSFDVKIRNGFDVKKDEFFNFIAIGQR